MAEKPEDLINNEDKIARAKELFALGTRNYYVKNYSEAADDLGEASKIYGEVYGVDGDELGEIYLLYAKSLIAIGQEENKLIEVPEEDEDEEEPVEEDDGEEGAVPETNGTAENGEKTNGHAEAPGDDPQPGPSTSNENGELNENEGSNDAQETENDDGEDGGNLEVAWEVLQNASVIFERQEKEGLKNLMEVYSEMAGIMLENGNFESSIKDFNRALDVFEDLPEVDQNPRIAAEIRYKIGLCQMMEKQYDESVKSFQAAADLIADVIEKEKAREEKDEEAIKDLEDMHQEILNKITEIGETKAEEVELVKREMMKMYGPSAGSSVSADGAGSSSSAGGSAMKSPEETNKPKPTDISHLIKRKKPEGDSSVEESPAKKKAVETSPGEKVAVPVEKVAEEVESVQVVEN